VTTTRNRERVRCKTCRSVAAAHAKKFPDANYHGFSGRFTLRKKLSLYVKPVRCPNCKGTNVVSVEAQRKKELAAAVRCYCNAIPFPHTIGSLRFCQAHTLAAVEPTEEELHYYQALLETKRGA
jgi:hypothetical protein